MKKNTASQTKRILGTIPQRGTQMRKDLVGLMVGESLTVPKVKWPFSSSVSEYLYTMRRIGRIYSYRTVGNDYLIIRNK